MESSENEQREKNIKAVDTFPVPFALEEIQENNIIISTNTSAKPVEEEIINHAIKLHLQGNISEAAKNYQYFISQGFNDFRIFSNYGAILKDIGNLKEAELWTRKAIKLNPNFADSHSNLGSILIDLGNLKEAELSTRKAISLNPSFANAYYNLGTILLKLGKLEEAELWTRKAIELDPDFANAYSSLGSILTTLGKLKEAEKSCSKAIELQPRNTLAIMNRWQLFFKARKFDLALKDADSCNTKESRACALETLFALGRIDEIYERIENSSELDDENIRLAAFSSFISEQENKDTSNNFCRNPLSFLHFSNLNLHLKDYVEFIKEIINELNEVETIWQPANQTTRNGFQTPTNINLFSFSSQRITELKTIISDEIDSYYSKFKQESCSFIQKWPSKKNFFAWHVILKAQGYQEAHIHPAGWLSGVIYLKVVPSLNNNEGAIELSLNGVNYSNVNSPKVTYQPKLGDIVLFPSSLHHRTIPFSTKTERMVVSFDLMPKSYKSNI